MISESPEINATKNETVFALATSVAAITGVVMLIAERITLEDLPCSAVAITVGAFTAVCSATMNYVSDLSE